MKKCVKFECESKTEDGCGVYGAGTDCTIRRCYQSCKNCKHPCKNQKAIIDRKGLQEKSKNDILA